MISDEQTLRQYEIFITDLFRDIEHQWKDTPITMYLLAMDKVKFKFKFINLLLYHYNGKGCTVLHIAIANLSG